MRLRPAPPAAGARLVVWAAGIALAAAPGRAAAQPPPAPPAPPAAAAPAAPDVRFMRHMIGHHAQAVALAALVPARSARADVRALAERIAAAQGDEMALMRRWLAARGVAPPPAPAPAGGAMDHAGTDHAGTDHTGTDHTGTGHAAADSGAAGAGAMPGMLTRAEMAHLAELRGPAFDRAFLAAMVRHHEGALRMVADLLAAPGAAQDPEAFRLAADVDAGQRAEVARMRRMLAGRPTR